MPAKHTFDYDLIVIGSGAGGSAAATIAAQDGKKVAIIESDTFGGDSPNWSDIPTKALLHAAHLYDDARHGARFGLRSSTLGYNYPSIRAWKNLAVKRTGAGGNRNYYDSKGVDTYNATAHFISPNEISVNRKHISAKYFLVATGASWVIPEIPGIHTVKCLTPRTILEAIRPPKSLLIIGGNEAGLEIAQLMATFGTKIYIVEKSDRLLPEYDSEIGHMIGRILTEQKGVTILAHSEVAAVSKDGLGKRIVVSRAGTDKSLHVDEILVAGERQPNTDLGLENAGIKYDKQGIKVSAELQTNVHHIFAAGEVIGHSKSMHRSIYESQVAVNNIFHRNKIVPDYSAMSTVIFTNPVVSTLGLNEAECKQRGLAINKAIAPLNIIARSNTADFRDGFVKIITNKKGVIVGASIVAPGASEMINELALAVRQELTAADIAATPHAFLSWSEAIRVAAAKLA